MPHVSLLDCGNRFERFAVIKSLCCKYVIRKMRGQSCQRGMTERRLFISMAIQFLTISPAIRLTYRISILILCVGGFGTTQADPGENSLVFEVDIKPILIDKCGKCHNTKVRKSNLDLSTIGAVRLGGESGEALIAESVAESLLWQMIKGGDMPPEGEAPLSEKERAVIRNWLATGAKAEEPEQPMEQKLTQHQVLPIFLLRCVTCHGPRIQDGDLDLRTCAAMLKGGKSGPALVPGDPDASLLIERIESNACPPRELLLKFFVKRPPSSEVKKLRKWIKAGAPEVAIKPDVATTEPDPLVTDLDRQHWAFQPPKTTTKHKSVDDFILEQLNNNGLGFSPKAARDTLIRRAYFDLIGMPPGLNEWQRWRGAEHSNWYEQMVDHLLESPRYGERWGRYWLDLAGYADSEGGISADPVRPVAWKYRDYVIGAFNNDKPYNRFLIEQIAGDELIDHENAPIVTQEIVDNLIATGFLRMGIDETGSRTMNFVSERLKVISDAITIVSSGLMGLTMECARCHSHKYDPIPQRDYYRFKAIFQGALDEHDWSSFKTRSLKVATPSHRERVAANNPPREATIKKLHSLQKKAISEQQLGLLRHAYPDQSEADNQATLVALKVADNSRTLPQRILVERLQVAELLEESELPESVLLVRRSIERRHNRIEQLRRKMEPSLAIRALWDFGRPSPTYILHRGEHNQSGRLVGPGVPSVLTDGTTPFMVAPPFPEGTHKTGRRLALARWLTEPNHPLTTRVMVNRIWYHHFGTGLVKELDNFGVKGGRPSHPELLDWLAVKFVEDGWSIKETHRRIMHSVTYRQSSRITDRHQQRDSQNRLLSHMPLRRLDAEALRDSLLFVAGKLDQTHGGIPDTVSVSRDGLVSVNPTEEGIWRRSVYLQYRRTEIPTIMDTFDYPQMGPNCVARNVSTVSPQSLMLMNNGRIRELAGAFAARVNTIVKNQDTRSDGAKIDTVYGLALSRRPTEQERSVGIAALKELESKWQGDSDKALETFCHVILNSAAFLYID